MELCTGKLVVRTIHRILRYMIYGGTNLLQYPVIKTAVHNYFHGEWKCAVIFQKKERHT